MTPLEDRYHYKLIARAIAEIDAAQADGEAPSLDALAARLGLSPTHFQKVFSAWVGISPKRYQQYLTLDQAKRLLATRLPLDTVAQEAGLSGTSRLHDLVLRWEAMTPGEFARAGSGVVINWGTFDTPFGPAIVMATERGICGMGFCAEMGEDACFLDLANRWPDATFRHAPAALTLWVEAIFAGAGDAPLLLVGAPFQIKVWEALLSVPSGHVTTYSDIANAIGSPRAVRAVGTAVGRNPISYLIPCHRALRKSGGLGGYHWGLPVKRALLAWESARAEA